MTKRRHLLATGLSAGLTALLALATPPAVAGVDVGVSIGFDQPGLYGRIDIGRFPYPQVIATTPVIVVPPAYRYYRARPVYLWVPPGHRRDWRRHCGAYGACSQPVVFVRDDWARQHVVRRGDVRHDGRWADRGRAWDRGGDRDRRWDRDHDRHWDRDGRGGWDRDDRDDDRGRGKGRGRGKD
jgi:hypothetical protein